MAGMGWMEWMKWDGMDEVDGKGWDGDGKGAPLGYTTVVVGMSVPL